MATLADELRLDFEDSGSEAGGHRDDDGFLDDDDEAAALMGTNGDVEMDAADLLSSDEDEEMDGVKEGRDNDQTEALGDLASVAALLKNLDPVLKVSNPPPFSPPRAWQATAFTSLYRQQP